MKISNKTLFYVISLNYYTLESFLCEIYINKPSLISKLWILLWLLSLIILIIVVQTNKFNISESENHNLIKLFLNHYQLSFHLSLFWHSFSVSLLAPFLFFRQRYCDLKWFIYLILYFWYEWCLNQWPRAIIQLHNICVLAQLVLCISRLTVGIWPRWGRAFPSDVTLT